jgi:release factor glutamine methyltransferase
MTFKQLEKIFKDELSGLYEANEALGLFHLTAEHVSGIRPATLMLQMSSVINSEEERSYQSILSSLKEGRPIQHIIGEAWFYGLKFKVNSAVLIPRPETEELVHWILESASRDQPMQFLDIGTGSGCIAVSLKKNLPQSKGYAMDISSAALEVAGENAAVNNVEIKLIPSDILVYKSNEQFDLIVSNPPYITPGERGDMHQNVLDFEPEMALFVTADDPLIFYKCIADFALGHLNSSGYMFFEINEYLGKEMIAMLTAKAFTDIQLKKDMQGKDRMIRCKIPQDNLIRSGDDNQ